MSDKIQIEKPISEQIIEKMIDKLKDSEGFSESTLTKLKNIDLTNKNDVKRVISNLIQD